MKISNKEEEKECPFQIGTFGCSCENCYKKIMKNIKNNNPDLVDKGKYCGWCDQYGSHQNACPDFVDKEECNHKYEEQSNEKVDKFYYCPKCNDRQLSLPKPLVVKEEWWIKSFHKQFINLVSIVIPKTEPYKLVEREQEVIDFISKVATQAKEEILVKLLAECEFEKDAKGCRYKIKEEIINLIKDNE